MSLDTYEKRPKEMENYLQYYGWHFNKKMCEFAISKMKKNGIKLQQDSKQKIDEILEKAKVVIENNQLWDYVYVYHMAKADFLGTSLIDEVRLAKFVKDYIDDEDGYDEIVFSRWYIDTVKKGIPIDWEEML